VSQFDPDTRVTAVAANDFAATVSGRWNALGGRPNGGYLLGICAQALRQTVALSAPLKVGAPQLEDPHTPFPDPLVVSAFFHRAAVMGPARVLTENIRNGRRLATGQARLMQNDREVMRAVATFTDLALVAMVDGQATAQPP
jgi:hypothetical protein